MLAARSMLRARSVLPRRAFRFLSDLSEQSLRSLESMANSQPNDPHRQLMFMRALGKDHPKAVVERFQTGQYAESPEVVAEYIKALGQTGRLESMPETELRQLFSRAVGNASPSAAAAPEIAALTKLLSRNSAEAPLQVALAGDGARSQFWKTVRTLGGVFLLVTGIGAIMDSAAGGITGRNSMFNEVQPAPVTDKTFADIKGADEAKEELKEIVAFLKDPTKFTRLGGKLPKGVLLMGSPGTGKTLLARAVAGEAGVPFFYCSGSEFEEMFVGVGARRVRDLFTAAKKSSPCIIFIDEIDAIGGTRNMKDHQALRMTLNQLLVEMDGFNPNEGIIVIGATNFPELLDKALIRPGRFDRQVVVPLPDLHGRKDILDLYLQKVACAKDVDSLVLARGTPGFSGAQLYNMVNMAAIRASQSSHDVVFMRDFEWAKDKIMMGAERKSTVMGDADRQLTAYHEGGHALVALFTDGAHPIHKATIMPRGQALGMVHMLPENDQYSVSRKQLLAQLDVCMGGRVAEELIFGPDNVTTGASSDLKSATNIATNMVTKWGMSDKVGPIDHDERSMKDISPETRRLIDGEIRNLLDLSKDRATALLQSHRTDLERIAKALLEYETLSLDEIRQVIQGKKLQREY
ncbi:AAA+ ATPase domain-containing protein [Plasmodiophora brassicae]|uniref:AAA+ ATPase domain-containing protein n=1 Tax=Plasmodiophora brassicae TaxID=37360 RepID=A0A3P3Y0Z8_PLABS|nr:unnamed protein product [Plasmodiophora brassicae]